jgi:hypothetical protein
MKATHEESSWGYTLSPHVVALLAPGKDLREGRGWGSEQAARIIRWWDDSNTITHTAGQLGQEGVDRHLAAQVDGHLGKKGQKAKQTGGWMSIREYVAAFPWLRVSDEEPIAPPQAVLPPVRGTSLLHRTFIHTMITSRKQGMYK